MVKPLNKLLNRVRSGDYDARYEIVELLIKPRKDEPRRYKNARAIARKKAWMDGSVAQRQALQDAAAKAGRRDPVRFCLGSSARPSNRDYVVNHLYHHTVNPPYYIGAIANALIYLNSFLRMGMERYETAPMFRYRKMMGTLSPFYLYQQLLKLDDLQEDDLILLDIFGEALDSVMDEVKAQILDVILSDDSRLEIEKPIAFSMLALISKSPFAFNDPEEKDALFRAKLSKADFINDPMVENIQNVQWETLEELKAKWRRHK